MHAEDRMYCYLWYDVGFADQCKFGERFVKAGQDPLAECTKRMRTDAGSSKGRVDRGQRVMFHIWDVSVLAEKEGRNHIGGHMDDWLRKQIGFVQDGDREFHAIHHEDMLGRVNRLLTKLGQPLIEASLSTLQYKVAEEVIGFYCGGSKIILASLCARFGKTIWSSAVALELDVEIVIVASYVKTVFTSFGSDITKFQQFAEYEHVDASEKDSEKRINQHLANGKKVFVYLSMANGSKRQTRIDYIFARPEKKMLIIDEADFGIHRENQALPLVDESDNVDYILIMTGTNADRAVTHWRKTTSIVSVTYPELLMQKRIILSNA